MVVNVDENIYKKTKIYLKKWTSRRKRMIIVFLSFRSIFIICVFLFIYLFLKISRNAARKINVFTFITTYCIYELLNTIYKNIV